jgi:hypothetical protein
LPALVVDQDTADGFAGLRVEGRKQGHEAVVVFHAHHLQDTDQTAGVASSCGVSQLTLLPLPGENGPAEKVPTALPSPETVQVAELGGFASSFGYTSMVNWHWRAMQEGCPTTDAVKPFDPKADW